MAKSFYQKLNVTYRVGTENSESAAQDHLCGSLFSLRIIERRNLLQNTEAYKRLHKFRNSLNKVQSTADFLLDAALNVLSYTNTSFSFKDG